MNDHSQYYKEMRLLASSKRVQYKIETSKFGLREVRGIYRKEIIEIHDRPLTSRLKAIYMCDDEFCSVAVRIGLPNEPKLFALLHELKHHWADQELLRSGTLACGMHNDDAIHEKTAEVFAAEFVYPEEEFKNDWLEFQFQNGFSVIGTDEIVHFKKNSCRAKVSYSVIRKKLEWLGFIEKGQFDKVKFQNREEELYGLPIYKQPWFKERRKLR